VLLVRPGFVIGRMTEGMKRAPLATTPAKVGAAVASALGYQTRGDQAQGGQTRVDPARGGSSVIWVPPALAGLAAVMKLIPRPVWRKLEN
jgi:decaprenylphospho-beta-D-erythro-pentofuranosid-2-ulose 2-reductase